MPATYQTTITVMPPGQFTKQLKYLRILSLLCFCQARASRGTPCVQPHAEMAGETFCMSENFNIVRV